MNKRGQSLPLNTIIIAIIVLVVLVVIVAIFVGRTGKFDSDVTREGNLEVIKLKASYSTCHPSTVSESDFVDKFSAAQTPQDKSTLKGNFAELITACKTLGATSTGCSGSPTGQFGLLSPGSCQN